MGQDLVTERHAGQKGGEEHKANTSFKENMKKKKMKCQYHVVPLSPERLITYVKMTDSTLPLSRLLREKSGSSTSSQLSLGFRTTESPRRWGCRITMLASGQT